MITIKFAIKPDNNGGPFIESAFPLKTTSITFCAFNNSQTSFNPSLKDALLFQRISHAWLATCAISCTGVTPPPINNTQRTAVLTFGFPSNNCAIARKLGFCSSLSEEKSPVLSIDELADSQLLLIKRSISSNALPLECTISAILAKTGSSSACLVNTSATLAISESSVICFISKVLKPISK